MKTPLIPALILAGVAAFVGCTSPDARIKRSPEVFERLSPEHQALVRDGKVGVGFDQDAVRLAVGAPDRVWTRTEAAGVSQVWSYTRWENNLGSPLHRGWYHQHYLSSTYYLNEPARREREYFKVVFGPDGRVTAIEEDAR